MKTRILFIIILIIIILLYLLQKNTKENFQLYYNIPKIVWSYWNNDTLPYDISLIVNNNKKKLEGWNYIVLTPSNINEYVFEQHKSKDTVSPEHYADWLRLYLLDKYGGVWMDISIILNKNFDDLYIKSLELNSELSGFNASHFNTTKEYPVIENWFIMAPRGSEVIHLWKQEYNNSLENGFLEYKKSQISAGVNYQNIFGNDINEVYFTQHGCLQVVLQKKLNRKARLVYTNANDSMFKLQSDCDWNHSCLKEKINDKSYIKNIPYIKLRGADRKDLDLSKFFD